MIKLPPFLIFSTMIGCQVVMADVALDTIPDDNPTQLKSIPLLQSLKIPNQQRQFYAPYVHELKNKYKVRTLFVESADLPMVDIQLTFNAGSARDEEIAPGLYGIANMAAKLIDEGTENYTANEIANALRSIQGAADVRNLGR